MVVGLLLSSKGMGMEVIRRSERFSRSHMLQSVTLIESEARAKSHGPCRGCWAHDKIAAL